MGALGYAGLRPGEKFSEDLFSAHEDRSPTTNPLVNSVDVPTLDVTKVRSLLITNHQDAAEWMRNESTQSVLTGV